MNNKFYQVVAVTVVSAFAHLSNAENYTSEVTGSYSSSDVDGQSSNIETYGVAQKVYFSEVDTSVGPLARAAFVSRASSYAFGYSEVDAIDADMAYAAIDWRDKDSGITLGLTYMFSDIDSDDSSTDEIVVRLGKYVGETTEVSVEYSSEKNKLNDIDVKDAYKLAISHVGTGDVGFAVDGSIGMTDTLTDDEQFIFSVAATLYPSRNFGLGAGFDIALADIDDDRVFAFAEWFFKPDVKAKATYFISDQNNIDITGLSLELSLRL